MFYDKRRVSTQISRLCHVHAQVHALKDMSSHTFCLMEMCPSTVWHLVSYYFVWCEGTINVMFTLKTLLGCVYVQLLKYKAAFLKNSSSWPTCLHASSLTKRGGDQSEHSILSRFSWSVSRLNRRGQSSWSVVLCGQSFFRGQSFFVDGVYILWWLCTRIYWDIWLGKTAVNVWTNVRGWVEHV